MADPLEERLFTECRLAERVVAAAEQAAVAAELTAGTAERYAALAGRRADLVNIALGDSYARYRTYLASRDS